MKPNTIVLTDQGIGCIEAPQELTWEDYNKAIEAAMKQVVLFKDQDIVCEIFSLVTGDIATMWYPEKGKHYPVPTGYEIKLNDTDCYINCVCDEMNGGKCMHTYAVLVPKQEPVKDWVEDFSHENGNYQNKCIKCGELFMGHKRRVVCKKCATVKQPTHYG